MFTFRCGVHFSFELVCAVFKSQLPHCACLPPLAQPHTHTSWPSSCTSLRRRMARSPIGARPARYVAHDTNPRAFPLTSVRAVFFKPQDPRSFQVSAVPDHSWPLDRVPWSLTFALGGSSADAHRSASDSHVTPCPGAALLCQRQS